MAAWTCIESGVYTDNPGYFSKLPQEAAKLIEEILEDIQRFLDIFASKHTLTEVEMYALNELRKYTKEYYE